MTTLQVDAVSAGYVGRPVLHNVSLELRLGEVVAILGPNGCGKSTLIRCLSRVIGPTSGEIRVGGRNVDSMSVRDVAQLIAVVPQHENIVFEFSSREIVQMGRFAHDGNGLSRVDVAMEESRCTELAERPISQLSGGERQRVLIARALAQDTPILLLDEPTAHMDIGYQIAILSHLRQMASSGKCVVAVLHDLNLAAGFANRAILMHAGRIDMDADVDTVLRSPEIDRVYGATFSRVRDPLNGRLVLVPEFVPPAMKSPRPRRIHVIGGGGSAAALMTELWQLGHSLTLGVAQELDSDLDAARRLGVPAVTVPPFSEVSDSAVRDALALADMSEVVLVCPAPYGTGNLRNLELAGRLHGLGKQLVWLDWQQKPWDFTSGEASQKSEALRGRDRVIWISGDVAATIENLP